MTTTTNRTTRPEPLSVTERTVLRLLRCWRYAHAADFSTTGQLLAAYSLATRGLVFFGHDALGRRAFYAELP